MCIPTCALAQRRRPPIGAKITPTAKNRGRTVFGVRIGLWGRVSYQQAAINNISIQLQRCPKSLMIMSSSEIAFVSMEGGKKTTYCHAFNLCCRNAVSITIFPSASVAKPSACFMNITHSQASCS